MTLPEMCNTCKQFMLMRICKDYNIPLQFERVYPEMPWTQDDAGTYTKTVSYRLKPDFSKWDGVTGLKGKTNND